MSASAHQRRAGLGSPTPTTPAPTTAEVVRSDTSGVWVAPVGTDTRHPVGPCRGATRPTSTGWERLPVGTVVLLVHTTAGPWVAAHDQPAT